MAAAAVPAPAQGLRAGRAGPGDRGTPAAARAGARHERRPGPPLNVLVVGGNRFLGHQLAWRLLARGHRVTVFNRGRIADPFGDRVERLRGDRTTADFARLLAGRSFDAAVDFAAFHGADTAEAVRVLKDRVGHYVMISTGQVYLVRSEVPRPTRESDYDGPLIPEPPAEHRDHEEWAYGMGKRAAEDALAEAWSRDRFPSTRLRIPMVNGERDHFRRLEGYLWRLFDGDGLVLPDGGAHRVRHVYGMDVVRTIESILGRPSTFGQAYNLCQQETPTLAELLALVGRLAGAPVPLLTVPRPEVEAAGLDPVAVSPFSGRWMSFLDASRAREEIGFAPEPLEQALDKIVTALVSHWPAQPPPGYAGRARERALIRARARSDGEKTTPPRG